MSSPLNFLTGSHYRSKDSFDYGYYSECEELGGQIPSSPISDNEFLVRLFFLH